MKSYWQRKLHEVQVRIEGLVKGEDDLLWFLFVVMFLLKFLLKVDKLSSRLVLLFVLVFAVGNVYISIRLSGTISHRV
jgi:hypothetical protein